MKTKVNIILWSILFCVVASSLANGDPHNYLTPPTFDFDDFCENESGFPSNVNPPGGTFAFAPDPGDGSVINPTTGEVTNAMGGSSYSIQYTAPGPGGGSTIVVVMVNPVPIYTFISSMCEPGNTWSVTFSTDANIIAPSIGAITGGGGTFTAFNIPVSSTLTLTLAISLTGCEIDVLINPPLPCPCATTPDPPVPGDTAYHCEGGPPPIIMATANTGLVIDWYDALTGGTLLASATNTYQSTGAGIYYAEARDPNTGCVSDRVAVVVVFVSMPTVIVSEDSCHTNGTIEFTISFPPGSEADSVTTSMGIVTNNQDGTFSVTGAPWNMSIDATVFFLPSGCSWTYSLNLPTCDCSYLDPPISLGDTTVCENTSPLPTLGVQVGSGQTANWYDQASGGSPIAIATLTFTPPAAGTYYVTSYDPVTDCESVMRTAITLSLEPLPTFNWISDSCNRATELYTFTFMSDALIIFPSQGNTASFGGLIYEISDLIGGTSFTLILESTFGCQFDTTFVVPICTCPMVDTPASGGNQSYCLGSSIPPLTVSVPTGVTVDWYDVMTGGTAIATGTTSFTPTAPGAYYAEARVESSGCLSSNRTAIVLTILPQPSFVLDSTTCVQSITYNIFFATDAAVVLSDQGTVSNVSNDQYVIDGCTVGTNTLITLESADGCRQDTLIQSPICNCPPLSPPISMGDTTICVGAPIPFLEVFVGAGYTVNWYDQASGGTPVATATTTYLPLTPGTYYASTVDPSSICESQDRTPVTLSIEALPFINIIGDSCNTNTQLYSFTFMTDAFTVEPSDGTLSVIGATIYTVSDLISGTSFTIVLTSLTGCQFDTTFVVPDCQCPTVDSPVSGGDQSYCIGDAIPMLTASVPAGFTVDWYDVANGGLPVATNTMSFNPTTPGTYYAVSRDLNSGCTSNLRTPIQLTILALPEFFIDSIRCANTLLYDIYFRTNADDIGNIQGILSDLGNDRYVLQGVVVGTSTLLTLETPNGCTLDTLIESPNCDCPLLDAPLVSADTFYCEGAVIPLLEAQTNSTFQIDWYDAAIGGNLLLSNSTTYLPTGPGTYYAEVYDPLSDCSSVRSAVRLDVASLPSFVLDSIFCVDTAFYSVRFISDASSFAFDLGAASSPDTNTYKIVMIPSGLPIVISVYSIEQCAVDTIIAAPNCSCPPIDAPISAGDTTFCMYDTIPPLIATSAIGYTINWFDAAIGGNLILAGSDTLHPPGTGTYYAEAIDSTSGCRSNIRSAVSAIALPLPTFVIDSMVCRADLTGYNLYFQSNADLIVSSLVVPIIQVGTQYLVDSVGSGLNLGLSLVDTNGCMLDTMVTGIVCGCPIVDEPVSAGNQIYCQGSLSIPLLAVVEVNGIRYEWYDSATGGTLLEGDSPALQLDSAGIVYVQAVDMTSGCISSLRTAIELIELPAPSFEIDSIGCQEVGYYHVFFSSNGTPTAFVGFLQTIGLNSYLLDSVPSSSDIQLSISLASCSMDTMILALDCNCPLIDPPLISDDTTICFGAAIPSLLASTTVPFIINWYDAAVDGNLLLEDSPIFTPTTNGIYFAEAVDQQSGCLSLIRSAVSIDQIAQITLNLPNDVAGCSLTGDLTATSSAAEIEWVALDGLTLLNNSGDQVNYVLPDYGGFQIQVTATRQGCQVMDTVSITSNEFLVTVDVLPPNCFDTLGVISLDSPSSDGPYSFIENSDTAISFNQFPYGLDRPAGNYQFIIENNSGCSQTVSIDIPEVLYPTIDLGPDIEGETGKVIRLNIQSNFTPNFYQWNTTDGLSDFNSLNPNITIDGNTVYVLTAIDSNGCLSSDSLSVRVLNSFRVYIPNAFSPNDDGINDQFNIYSNSEPLVEQFQIFNRWGGVVFERSGVNLSQLDGWSGYQNSKLSMSGVYIYVIKLIWPDGSSDIYTGEITLIR